MKLDGTLPDELAYRSQTKPTEIVRDRMLLIDWKDGKDKPGELPISNQGLMDCLFPAIARLSRPQFGQLPRRLAQ